MSNHSSTLDHAHDSGHHGPKNPERVYLLTLIALLFLTFITVLVAQFDLGEFNVIVAMAVATAKVSLVALFFMHLLYDKPMNSIIFMTAVIMLGLLFIFSFMDSDTRQAVIPRSGQLPAGADFNRPAKLGEPFGGEKKDAKPAPVEVPR